MSVGSQPRRHRPRLDLHSRACHLEVGEHRFRDRAGDARQDVVEPVLAFDELPLTSAGGGEPVEEAGVDCPVDPDREHASLRQQGGDGGQYVVLSADLPVGDQYESALAGFVRSCVGTRTRQQRRSLPQRLSHLRPAPGRQAGQPADRRESVAVGRGHQRVVPARVFDDVVEAENLEAVVAVQRIDDPGGRAPGCHDLPPLHRPGPVQQDDHIPGRSGSRVRRRGCDDRHRPGAAVGLVGVRHDHGGGLQPVPGNFPAHQQVPVQPLAGGQSQPNRFARPLDGCRMQRGAQVRDAQPGRIEAHRNVEVGTLVGWLVTGRRHPAGVGDRIGVAPHAQPRLLSAKFRPSRVPLGDDERKAVGGFAGFHGNRPGEFQLDHGVLAGHQVADARAEHLRPVFLGDGGPLAGGHGEVIGLASRLALLEQPGDPPSSEGRGERRHRRPAGKREDVGDFDGRVGGVGEALPDARRCGQTDHDRVNVDSAQRQDPRACPQHPGAREVVGRGGLGGQGQALQRGHGVLLCLAGLVAGASRPRSARAARRGRAASATAVASASSRGRAAGSRTTTGPTGTPMSSAPAGLVPWGPPGDGVGGCLAGSGRTRQKASARGSGAGGASAGPAEPPCRGGER